jgi:hypothetical protein
MSKLGSPKSFDEALLNALKDIENLNGYGKRRSEIQELQAKVLKDHIKDFLAQRFGVFTLRDEQFTELWETIFPKDKT